MMFQDLTTLIEYVDNPEALKKDYIQAIENDNCLGKKSGQTRKISSRHLKSLYSLDPGITLFRAMLFFWNRDPKSRPLLALLCTIARDAVFRMSVPFIQSYADGLTVEKKCLRNILGNEILKGLDQWLFWLRKIAFSKNASGIMGGLIIIGEINLGGSIEPVHNAVTLAELAVEKGATAMLMPVNCRRRLFDLSDDMATKLDIQFYLDARDALLKSISE